MNFLIDFFNLLEESKVSYCVLRNYEQLPLSTGGSDLDILINKEQKAKFVEVLRQTLGTYNGKVVSVVNSNLCPRYCLIGNDSNYWGLMIDLHLEEIKYRGHTIVTNNKLWDNISYFNGICVLNKKTDSLISLFKELLNNSTCTEKQFDSFRKNSLDEGFLFSIFNEPGKSRIVPALMECGDKKYSNEEIHRLLRELNAEFPNRWYTPFTKLSKLARLFKRPGYSIAVLGTDGAGKSTVIDKIMSVLKETFHNAVYYKHLRPGYLPPLARLLGSTETLDGPVTNPHASEPSGFFGSFFRWAYYLLDYSLGYYLKIYPKKATKSCVWIFDRYYYDYYFDQRRSRITLPNWIIRSGQFLIPEPDIILCLGADPSVIHDRKPELPLQEVGRQVKELKQFSERHKRAVWIDTGTSIEESTNNALDSIIKVMAKRFENVSLY